MVCLGQCVMTNGMSSMHLLSADNSTSLKVGHVRPLKGFHPGYLHCKLHLLTRFFT